MGFTLESTRKERPIIQSKECVPGHIYRIWSTGSILGSKHRSGDIVYCVRYINGNMLVCLKDNFAVDVSTLYWNHYQFQEIEICERVVFQRDI